MISYNLTHFILAGFTLNPAIKTCVVTTLILIYMLSLMGNLMTIMITTIDQHLQAPMYFFLRTLATLDILFISSTAPKLLSILVRSDNVISLKSCLLQLYFYVSAGGTEFYILGVMSIDRYIAICHPLRYHTIMTSRVSWSLILTLLMFGFLEFIPSILLMSHIHWCNESNVIDHFFCDGSALLQLSCTDTYEIKIMFFYFACFAILSSLIPTIASYYFIILTILRISSSTRRRKTFSTCSSHFIAVLFAYGSCLFLYVSPAGITPFSIGKSVGIFNSILCPLLHPFIYTLRNEVVISRLRHVIPMMISFK